MKKIHLKLPGMSFPTGSHGERTHAGDFAFSSDPVDFVEFLSKDSTPSWHAEWLGVARA